MNKENKTISLEFDHVAVAIGNTKEDLEKYEGIFRKLGFVKEWKRKRIGNNETAMSTSVMSRGKVKLALMEGIDGYDTKGRRAYSQVSAYYKKFGLSVQHIALRCGDIETLIQEWSEAGVRFLTEDENHKPRILVDKDKRGNTVLQCFTYPINKTLFFELKQIVKDKKRIGKFEEFRDANVEGLWSSLDTALKKGWLFKVNIFGEVEK